MKLSFALVLTRNGILVAGACTEQNRILFTLLILGDVISVPSDIHVVGRIQEVRIRITRMDLSHTRNCIYFFVPTVAGVNSSTKYRLFH